MAVNRFVLNNISYHGAGAIGEIPGEITRRGFAKAFVCSDPDLVRFGVTGKVTAKLDEAGIPWELYDQIKPNPTIKNVQDGVAAFKASGADMIVAVGGGSAMDTAKGIGIIAENPEFADVVSLEGVAPTKNHATFTIAVPTTAGTAAEVTINYVITDPEKVRKFVCVDVNDIPDVAVVDPDMMASMPAGLTAATGMDALTHAIEGYTTKGAWELSDMFHLKAIELISRTCARRTPRRSRASRAPAARVWRLANTSPAWASPTSVWASIMPWRTRCRRTTTRRTAWRAPCCCRWPWSSTNRCAPSAWSTWRVPWASTLRI